MRIAGAVLTALVALTVVSGCTGHASSTTSASSSTFVYAPNLDVVTDWDPATSYSNEIRVMGNVYETLTRYNTTTKKVEPLLATSWKSSDDGRTWTFTLRDGVKFHSGRTLDATAVKESIERTQKLAGGAAYIWESVDAISAPDPHTVVFTLKYPAPIDLISSSAYAAYVYDVNAGAGADLKQWVATGKDAGSGPYTVKKWAKGQEVEVTLSAFDRYWGGWKGSHYKSVEYRVTPDLTTAWQLLQSGDVQMVERLTPQLFDQAKHTTGISTSSTPSFQNLIAFFNTADGPMADPNVRKAVRDAIDYHGLVSSLGGAATVAHGVVPEGLLGYDDKIAPRQDLAAAKAELQKAGYGPGGKPLTLTMTYAQGDSDQQQFATLLSSSLQQLGVTLQAQPLQWNAQWDKGKSDDHAQRQDIFLMYWYPDYADPYSWFVNLYHSADPAYFNMAYWNSPAADTLIDGLPALTATDRGAAQKSYEQLQQMVQDDAVSAVLYVQTYQRAWSGTVKGYADNPAYPNVPFVYGMGPGGN
ncbi:ABC transporter substrate-binding protein [Microbacterium sp. 13-71-7]|jgi:peptide/nickel transport system substrate-binding protein|uniref:ABC transporter substrate-binding protein n=1 Tax=Microbacterium sp. 13-71-7 TaxID=1970399 RepID=UPI0025E4CCBE|nr:ABC transporter substrate-binding protein [Microbacterium sp. 13-71-7]